MKTFLRTFAMAIAATVLFSGCQKENPDPKVDPQDDHDYLTFEAVEAGATVKLEILGKLEAPSLEFSTDKLDWTSYDFGKPQTITLKNVGDKVYWRNTGTTNKFSSFSDEGYIHFDLGAKKIAASGNIMSLLDINCEMNEMPDDAYFMQLFDCDSMLVSTPELPATKLSPGCYSVMFRGCKSLEKAPALPAETLAESCYYLMFDGCTSLTKAPELPAARAVSQCYVYMFRDCTSLVAAPELPATELDRFCYCGMFLGCTKLKKAPELPAEKLGKECYGAMFRGCTSLEEAPELPVMDLAEGCYSQMFLNCVSLKTAPELPAPELKNSCYEFMFCNTALEEAPVLSATSLTDSCYLAMFQECTKLKKAPELPATKMYTSCYQQMFMGCESLETAPELPATEMAEMCYGFMFYDCSSLNHIKVAFKDWEGGDDATYDWLHGVAGTGNFECPDELEVKYGPHYIPTGWSVNGAAPAATKSFAAPATKATRGSHLKPLTPITPDIQDRLIEHKMIML